MRICRNDESLLSRVDTKTQTYKRCNRDRKNEAFEVGNKRKTPIMKVPEISGGDALMGHTRSHPEHDG